MSRGITIRALIQIDRLQPKFAAYTGATVQGSVPLSGDTVLIGELAPGNGVFGLIDVALKASSVEATTQLVEGEFGFFILRSPSNSEVSAAREAVLTKLGLAMTDRLKPSLDSTQVISPVEPYQAQLLNKWRKGALLEVGARLEHVVRTRALLRDISKAGEFARAHGEVFAGIDPVTSGVEVGLTTPGMMVEIEVDALVHDESGIHW